MDNRELNDRAEIRSLMDRYAIACDVRDWALYRSLFTEECVIDYREFGGERAGLEKTIEWLSAGLSRYAGLHHNMTTHHCDITGDTARAVTYFIAYHTSIDGDGEAIMEVGGFYRDRLVRTLHGWRIAERVDLGTWLRTPIIGRLKAPPKWYGTMDHHRPTLLDD